MSDFETHEIGTATELRLSRALAREIESTIQQYGLVIPGNVLQCYYALMNHYAKALQNA